MKLNQIQRYVLLAWMQDKLGQSLYEDSCFLYDYDRFCDGEITEWRVVGTFGMAGKIWNNGDHIYITGYSSNEIGKKDFDKQQKMINEWNEEIWTLLGVYSIS